MPFQQAKGMAVRREHQSHPRGFGDNRYVYAVLSRRSGGISIGINLNPDKHCNFACVYCQVDRQHMPPPEPVNLKQLTTELGDMLAAARDGSLFAEHRFRDLPEPLKQVRDIALSGDGEPTQCTRFSDIAKRVTDLAAKGDGPPIPVVLITNATGLDLEGVITGVDRIMAGGGAVWAKLDAGTADYYYRICGQTVPFQRVIDNLTHTAKRHPITLQTCLFNIEGSPPPDTEIDAYGERVTDIVADGGTIQSIQLYTVSRPPAQGIVSPLDEAALERIATRLENRLPEIPLQVIP